MLDNLKKETEKEKKEARIKQRQELNAKKEALIDAINNDEKIIEMPNNNNLSLDTGEYVNISLKNINLLEPRPIEKANGENTESSYEIPKKRSLRGLKGDSANKSKDEISKIDTGDLTITNKRIVFSGDIKTLEIDLNKISDLTPYGDGIAINQENKEKPEYFTRTNDFSLNITFNDENIKIFIDGLILQAIIQQNIRNLKN